MRGIDLRTRYLFVTAGLLLLAILFAVLSATAFSSQESWAHRPLVALAEALLVSFIIATVVEPYMRRRFVHDVVSDSIWGFLNRDVPSEYREALGLLAGEKLISTKVQWAVDFSWQSDDRKYVALQIHHLDTGKNYGDRPVTFDGRSWILPSSSGFESRFIEWTLMVPEDTFYVSYSLEQLAQEARRSEDTVSVDRSKLSMGKEIAAGKYYVRTMKSETTRHSGGHAPLVYSRPSISNEIQLAGDALEDLLVRVRLPTGAQLTFDGKKSVIITNSQIGPMFTRQMFIVSWEPRDQHAARKRAAANAKNAAAPKRPQPRSASAPRSGSSS